MKNYSFSCGCVMMFATSNFINNLLINYEIPDPLLDHRGRLLRPE